MALRFSVESTDAKPAPLRIVYRDDDYSFDAVPQPKEGVTSLLVNELHLEIAADGRMLYVWGYCPYNGWKGTAETPRVSRPGVIRVSATGPLVPGVSIELNPETRWPVHVNRETGWVKIARSDWQVGAVEVVEFAASTLAVLLHENLVGLWLHPHRLPR